MTRKQIERIDRIRAARGLPPQTRENLMRERQSMMGRMAAVRCIADAVPERARREIELRGFMAVMHPETPPRVVDALVRDSKGRQ